MCGFFVCNFKLSNNSLASVVDQICLRGPDDLNSRVSEGGSYVFSRLTAFDPSSRSMQPLNTNKLETDPVNFFNGDIYNFRELSDRLDQKSITAVSDTIVLEEYIKRYKFNEFVPDLNGSFAICSAQENFKKVVFVRDIFGQKPLFYWYKDNYWAVSSDIHALYQVIKPKVSLSFLEDYIRSNEAVGTRGFYGAHNTQFQGIFNTVPGDIYTISKNGLNVDNSAKLSIWNKLFWDSKKVSLEPEEFLRSFDDVVVNYFNNDIENVLTLSGGVDSSLICFSALKNKEKAKAFTTITKSIGPVASNVKKDFGKIPNLEITSVDILEGNYVKDTIDYISYSAGPPRWGTAPSMVPLYRSMRDKGFKMSFGGDGGDELFFGHKSHIDLVKDFKNGLYRKDINFLAKYSLSSKVSNSRPIFDSYAQELLSIFAENSYQNPNGLEYQLSQVRFLDLNYFIPYIAAAHADSCAAGNGVGVRAPFFDFEIVKLAISESTSIKALIDSEESKALLRISAMIASRKYGFDKMHFINQPKEGTRNFAVQSFGKLNASLLPQSFLTSCGFEIDNSIKINPKMNFKLICAYIFFLFFNDEYTKEEVNEALEKIKI